MGWALTGTICATAKDADSTVANKPDMILFIVFSLKASSLVPIKTGRLRNCSAKNSKLLICNASRRLCETATAILS
jgi:hypothetical protein